MKDQITVALDLTALGLSGHPTCPGPRRAWWTPMVVGLACIVAGCGGDATTGAAPEPFWLQDAGGRTPADGGGDASAPDAQQGQDGGPTTADSGSPDAAGPQDAGATQDAGASDDAGGPAESEEFFATWRVSRRMTQDPSPFGSAWKESRTTTLGLVRVIWKGDEGTSWHHVCAMDANEVHGSQVTFPPAFLATIPVPPLPLTRGGATWTQPAAVELLGLKPDHTGPMPGLGQEDHASVIDADKDGHPGVTVQVKISLLGLQEIYVAQRTTSAWQGTVASDGRVSAQPSVDFEQVTLGASMSLLVAETNEKAVSSGAPETLLWVPVPAETTCKALIADAAALVGNSWPP